MSRSLARRCASVLVATALLGGGLALGGGTASAAEPAGGSLSGPLAGLLGIPVYGDFPSIGCDEFTCNFSPSRILVAAPQILVSQLAISGS
ncbi:hypothetical protein FK531_16640 [Rhodococcus spelaei]|uniref:Secreted protein n=1 Tax=Rhodococcus spelaei TaxID=2546320 RepID=A0A541B4E7_9NOCA|nr:hypothetical protein [Rhodococcus spelaei]TQF67188.1 hypothetical protein FK531_16640 [Rhodococcus spelaei]